MSFLIESLSYLQAADNPGELLVAAVLRVSLVLLGGAWFRGHAACALAAVRHRVYGLALLATLVVPIVWAAVPAWQVAVVEAQPAAQPAVEPGQVSARFIER